MCVPKATCANGTPSSTATDAQFEGPTEQCESCNSGYTLKDGKCVEEEESTVDPKLH